METASARLIRLKRIRVAEWPCPSREQQTHHDSNKQGNQAAYPEAQKLADFLCFAVYSANLTLGKAYKPLLDTLGLTYTQYITVVALYAEAQWG